MISPAMQTMYRIAAGEPMGGLYHRVTRGVTHGMIKYDRPLNLTLQCTSGDVVPRRGREPGLLCTIPAS